MLTNKKKDMTPFDMQKPPKKQYPFLLPLIWGGSYLMTRKFGLKITKKNMKGIKPPFLVISTHQGFADYYITPLALSPHRANYVSDMEGFAAFGEWLYRGIGCIGKRRYVPDISVITNIKWALSRGQSVVIYPESRHANVGTTSYIPKNIGGLAKMMKVPLVTLSAHGSYLANPFWDEEHTRKVPMEAVLECIYTADELRDTDAQEIQKRIEAQLTYDEYAWQRENKISISDPNRAEGLHMALYQCKTCGKSFQMESKNSSLSCLACHTTWEMNEYGQLVNKGTSTHIPDWYEWERAQVEEEIEAGTYHCDFKVRVEALPNAKGFVSLGEGMLSQKAEGFTLTLPDRQLFFETKIRESVQTEYNYRGRGPCIVLSQQDCCYYIYCDSREFNPTKIQFAGEYFYRQTFHK